MKLVKEYISEKFTEDSDPIQDMNIGLISEFLKFMELFSHAEKKNYIYTIHVESDFIDFWFNAPKIIKLSKKQQEKLPNYIKNIISDLGFKSFLTQAKLISFIDCNTLREKQITKIKPGIVRFKLSSIVKNKIKSGSYRRRHRIFTIQFNEPKEIEYLSEIEKFKKGEM